MRAVSCACGAGACCLWLWAPCPQGGLTRPRSGLGPWGHPMGPRVRDLSVCRRVGVTG